LVIDGVRFLGATLWTDFELAIETPEGPVSDVGRAMKMATIVMSLVQSALCRARHSADYADRRTMPSVLAARRMHRRLQSIQSA
jgi:hypothetical protein